ncbi:MAG: 2Fe-2S iron-sulfur cluster binding domain-containing protein [Ignavibacteriaceae bacterium]|nr:2Fe-2S iron-sulfur cluster binding domain-containing protein [Ignavibacteriaceae bacterium]
MKSGLLKLKITEINNDSKDCLTVYFNEATGKSFNFVPGQFLTLIFNDGGTEIRRCYSIFTTQSDLPKIGIAIKKVEGGYVSKNVDELIKPGIEISSLIPMGNFNIDLLSPGSNLVLFGAGSGITPLFSILKEYLFSHTGKTILFYQNRNENSIIFEKELQNLSESYKDRFSLIHILSKPGELWGGLKGRIDKDKAKFLFNSVPVDVKENAEVFLCGPEGMMTSVTEALTEDCFNSKRIHREHYHLSITQESFLDVEPVDRSVTIIFDGKTYKINVPPKSSILETALEEGIDLPFSCQIGSCSSCMAKLVSGQVLLVDQSILSDDEIKRGFCLTCVGFPVSDQVIVNFDDPSLP